MGREDEGVLGKPGGGLWRESVNCWALIPGRGLLLLLMIKTTGGNSPDALLFTVNPKKQDISQVSQVTSEEPNFCHKFLIKLPPKNYAGILTYFFGFSIKKYIKKI